MRELLSYTYNVKLLVYTQKKNINRIERKEEVKIKSQT